MTISIRLNDEETMLIKKYAEMNGISVSELVRKAVIEHIEDEYDLKLYEEAMKRYEEDPKTYTQDEVERELGVR